MKRQVFDKYTQWREQYSHWEYVERAPHPRLEDAPYFGLNSLKLQCHAL